MSGMGGRRLLVIEKKLVGDLMAVFWKGWFGK